MPSTHVVISTHTTRHLRATLLGMAIQTCRPASIVVSIDNDRDDVRQLCTACSRECALPLILAWRRFPGLVRVGQVRNNGVRALLARPEGPPPEEDWVHLLDGDSVAPPGMLAEAERVRRVRDLLVGGRILLTEEQTARFDEAALRAGAPPCALGGEQTAEVLARHRRYARQAWWKRFGFVKPHKPKVLGANHACTLHMYTRADGYDETFLGAWREDDDFGRRVYLAGGRSVVAVRNVCVYHMWHPLNPQKRENWSELPATEGRTPWLPKAGLRTPAAQEALSVERIIDGTVRQTWTVGPTATLAGSPA